MLSHAAYEHTQLRAPREGGDSVLSETPDDGVNDECCWELGRNPATIQWCSRTHSAVLHMSVTL